MKAQTMEDLIGKKVMLFCLNYIYAGKLVGVNEENVQLEDAFIVYETGELDAKSFKDAQRLPATWHIKTSCVESFGISGR